MFDPVPSAASNIPHVIVVAPVAVSVNVPVQAELLLMLLSVFLFLRCLQLFAIFLSLQKYLVCNPQMFLQRSVVISFCTFF